MRLDSKINENKAYRQGETISAMFISLPEGLVPGVDFTSMRVPAVIDIPLPAKVITFPVLLFPAMVHVPVCATPATSRTNAQLLDEPGLAEAPQYILVTCPVDGDAN